MISEIPDGYIFAFCAICMIGKLFWIIYVMMETKGVSFKPTQRDQKLNNNVF